MLHPSYTDLINAVNSEVEPGEQPVVTLTNRSRQAGRIVTADAVKVGGGYGNVARSVSDSLRRPGVEYAEETSGYPRFCEGARYWLQWAGFDPKVYTPKENADDYKDDYMSRAHWVNALMGGSERMPDSTGLRIPVDMALAFHSDAGVRLNDETIGTLGIFYTRENKGRFEGGADRYRSRDLTDIVMTQIVSDIRRTCEPEWNRRGLWNRAYYEGRTAVDAPSAPQRQLCRIAYAACAFRSFGTALAPEFRRHALWQRPALQVPREPCYLQGYLAVYQFAVRITLCSAAAACGVPRRGVRR